MSTVKNNKERIFKASEKNSLKQKSKGTPIRLPAGFSAKLLAGQKRAEQYFQSAEQKILTKNILTSKVII